MEGLEPPTLGLEIRCSIRLSYTPAGPRLLHMTGFQQPFVVLTHRKRLRSLTLQAAENVGFDPAIVAQALLPVPPDFFRSLFSPLQLKGRSLMKI